MRPSGAETVMGMTSSKQVLEFCRQRAVELIRQGESKEVIAHVLGVSRASVNNWWQRAVTGDDLKVKTGGGRPRRLTGDQLRRLTELLKEGPEAQGWANNLWTTLRVREVIKREFGVVYCRSQVWRVLTGYLDWTAKRPVQQQRKRNDDEVAAWKVSDFPRILREAAERKATLAVVDETGFMMYPTVRKSFSPRGEAPVNLVTDPHGRVSTIGAIAIRPRGGDLGWHYHMLKDNTNFRGPGVVEFLTKLRSEVGGPLTVLWDQIIIHSCGVVQDYLKAHPDIRSELLPAYAPELNPVDGAWFYIKFNRIPNFVPASLQRLRHVIGKELKRLQKHPELLMSFVRASQLPPLPPHTRPG